MQMSGEGGFNAFAVFGTVLVYGVVMLIIVYKSFSLVHELPTAVLKWLGVSTNYADLGENEAQGKTLLVAGAVGTAASSAAHAALQGKNQASGSGKQQQENNGNNESKTMNDSPSRSRI